MRACRHASQQLFDSCYLIANCQSHISAFTYCFRSEERVEDAALSFLWNAQLIICDADNNARVSFLSANRNLW